MNFKKSFKENIRHEYCNACWKQEEQGITSNRKNFTKNYGYLDDGISEEKVSFIELKTGNKCNLRCGICNPQNSSVWAHTLAKDFNEPSALKFNDQARWVEQEGLWNSGLISQAKVFHIMGGEPFLIKQNEKLIDHLIENAAPKEVTIWYNTNGTIFPASLMEKLKPFKKIKISFSLDHYGKGMEFQRYPAKWNKIEENLMKFHEVKQPNFFYMVDVCWSIFNVLDFVSIVKFYENFLENCWRMNPKEMSRCRHFYAGEKYSLNNLQPHEKIIFKKKLGEASKELSSDYNPLIGELTSWLESPSTEKHAVDLRERSLRDLESVQKMRLSEYLPELSQVLSIKQD